MDIAGPTICHVDTCPHGCTRDSGCQGIEWRTYFAEDNLRTRMANLIADAAAWGFVVTIEQKPLMPPAMGNYQSVASVRRARGAA